MQALYVGGRDRAFDARVDLVDISSYVVFDFVTSIALGPGNLQIGIHNLFNNQDFPVASQYLAGFDEQFNAAGVGRTLRVGYSVTW
ncbi:TonB-dependent receptor [Myxacorys almedinensis]|uniref:TonB-dependent receptor n=1 Tax=Myxacorys almedinensis A TaxID=2690445 RepID=A0A8J7Z2B7_9CYAN|nr:TonB-dependent receptor [Myxacorys almedinensis]NDJ16891.1 TonB-dependent receptor [Myxacorys almedinensis A]